MRRERTDADWLLLALRERDQQFAFLVERAAEREAAVLPLLRRHLLALIVARDSNPDGGDQNPESYR